MRRRPAGSSSTATRGRCTGAPGSRSRSTWPSARAGQLPPAGARVPRRQPGGAGPRGAREAAAAVARQARANRRLRLQLVAIAVALVVALVGGCHRPRPAAADAEQRAARWRPPVSSPRRPTPTSPTIPSAACCWPWPRSTRHGIRRRTVLPEAVEALHEAVASLAARAERPRRRRSLDWSPDGTIFVTEGPEDSRPGRHPRRRRPARRCARSTATTSTSTTSPSAPTARCSPRPVTTAPSGCGIPPPATSEPPSSSRADGHDRRGGPSFSPDGAGSGSGGLPRR